MWSFPVNLRTFEQMLGRQSTTEEMEGYLATRRVYYGRPPLNAEEAVIAQVGWDLYEKFYKGYTQKQWGRHPRELAASVCTRVPIRTTRDARYFNDSYQCMPKAGYSAMFDRMLAASTGLELWLNTDYREFLPYCRYKHLVYTGPIDEFFDYACGPLPYRSLRFEHESYCREFYQPTIQVAYPNSEEYTRIIEIKHATQQQCRNTTIVKEYPEEWVPGKEPYYPVPSPSAAAQYEDYKALADARKDVTFVGRLATYRYLNMDQVVASSLAEFEKLRRTL
jgi:UDP-galactopyranose mutase